MDVPKTTPSTTTRLERSSLSRFLDATSLVARRRPQTRSVSLPRKRWRSSSTSEPPSIISRVAVSWRRVAIKRKSARLVKRRPVQRPSGADALVQARFRSKASAANFSATTEDGVLAASPRSSVAMDDGTGIASGALTSLGGDLTFSVAWAIARELLDAGNEAQLTEAELVGMVLCTSIVLTAVARQRQNIEHLLGGSFGMLDFVGIFVEIAQRISMSVCVQLLAGNVHTQQPLRSVRIVTLLGVAVFFVFLQSTAALNAESRARDRGTG
jgi:hypothetical protein